MSAPLETQRTKRERRYAARAFSVGGGSIGPFFARGRRRAVPVPVVGCSEVCPRHGIRCVGHGEHEHQVRTVGEQGEMVTSTWGTP